MRLEELKEMLLARDYKLNIINECIRKARAMPRTEALKDVEKEIGPPRPVFVVLYDPRMPSISGIVKKHWRSMVHSINFATREVVYYRVIERIRIQR